MDVPEGGPGQPIPGLGVSPEVDQTLAGLQDKGVSQLLTLPGNRLVAIVLNHRTPARPALLDEVTDKVKSAYIIDQSQKIAHEKALEAAERIRKGEDPQAVAKSMKLEATTSTEFSRNDSVEGLGPAVYVEEAFSKPAGTVVGPIPIQGKDVVYKILDRNRGQHGGLSRRSATSCSSVSSRKSQGPLRPADGFDPGQVDRRRQGQSAPRRDPEAGRVLSPLSVSTNALNFSTSGGALPIRTS